MTASQMWIWWTLAGAGTGVALWLFVVWLKGRPFAAAMSSAPAA